MFNWSRKEEFWNPLPSQRYELRSSLGQMYSADRTQPNTKADPESGPGVRFGSASSPLFKNLHPLWVHYGVRSESALGQLGSALRPLL